MTAALRQTWQINLRYLRAFIRQPAWVAIALVQPVIWLLLFGALFKSVVDIPGFEGTSYIAFLTPGVAVMTAVMSAGWNGMGFIEDMRRGVLDRVLVTPLWRGALNAGSLLARRLGGGSLERARARREAARDADRRGHLRDAADHVPLVHVHAEEPRAPLGAERRAVQPGQLGGRGRPFGDRRAHRLGARRLADRLPRPLAARVGDDRDEGVQRLPALDLAGLEVAQDCEHAPVVGVRRREPQLLEDVLHVLLDGALRDHELFRDRRVGTAFRHQTEHLALARTEVRDRPLPASAREQLRDDLGVDRRPAVPDALDGAEELADVGDAVLEHVADAAEVACEQLARIVLLDVLRQHDDRQVRPL